MYAVECLRQLAMKFLERDELANYTFQNDFLRPFVVVMRQSQVHVQAPNCAHVCMPDFVCASFYTCLCLYASACVSAFVVRVRAHV